MTPAPASLNEIGSVAAIAMLNEAEISPGLLTGVVPIVDSEPFTTTENVRFPVPVSVEFEILMVATCREDAQGAFQPVMFELVSLTPWPK